MDQLNLLEIFSTTPSYRDIEVQPHDSEETIIVKIRGLCLLDILANQEVFKNLLLDFQNLDIAGKDILNNFRQNISKECYTTINNCIVEDDQRALYTPEFIKKFWDTSVINECILDIVDLTLPSKKKLMKQRETTNRILKKIEMMQKRIEN